MSKFQDQTGTAHALTRALAGAALLTVVTGCAQGPDAVDDTVITIRDMIAEPEVEPDAEPQVAAQPTSQPTAMSESQPLAQPAPIDVAQPEAVEGATDGRMPKVVLASAPVVDAESAPDDDSRDMANALLGAATGQSDQGSRQVPAVRRPSLELGQIDYFNTPEFSRNFALSFLRRSEIDPPISVDEIEPIQEIIELIQKGKKDRAMQKLVRENDRYQSPTYEYTIGQLLFDAAREEQAKDEPDEETATRLYTEAIPHYEAAISLFGNYLNAEHNLALIYYRLGEYREAADHFSRELQLGGVDVWTYGLLGDSLMKAELFLPAETAFRNAIMLDPFNTSWSLGLSVCLFKQQRYGETIALVDGLIQDEPDRADLWLRRGNAFMGMEKYNTAAECFRVAQRLGGATPQSLNLMAGIYTNDGLCDLAVDAFLDSIDVSMESSKEANPGGAIRAVRSIIQRGDTASAKRLLDGLDERLEGTMSDENKDAVLKLRSRVAVLEGNSEDEIGTLIAIVDRNPLDGEAFIMLGEAYERGKQFAESSQAFDTAAGIESFEALARRKHGQMLARQGLYDEAAIQLKASLQASENSAVRDYLGEVQKAASRRAK